LDEPGGTGWVGEVDRDGCDAGQAGQRVGVQGAGNHLGALLGERLGHGEADALAGAGDHRRLPLEQQVHGCLPRLETMVRLNYALRILDRPQ